MHYYKEIILHLEKSYDASVSLSRARDEQIGGSEERFYDPVYYILQFCKKAFDGPNLINYFAPRFRFQLIWPFLFKQKMENTNNQFLNND